jgi:BolA protein
MNEQEIIDRVLSKYPDAIIDISGEDCSFELYIISDAFAGKRSLLRQQSILGLFASELSSGKLHALGLVIKTPEEQAQTAGGGLVQLKL